MTVTYGDPSPLDGLLAALDGQLASWPTPLAHQLYATDTQRGTSLMAGSAVVPGNITFTGSITVEGALTPAGVAYNGMQYLTGAGAIGSVAGTITPLSITAAQALGFQGFFLDPRFIWDASGLVIDGISNFCIESRMCGSIGWNAGILYNTGGYIKTDTGSPADGVKMQASSPASAPTQGFTFRQCVFSGTHSGAAVHMAGGQRKSGLIDCMINNPSTAANSYGLIYDAATGSNSEDCIFRGLSIAGGWAAIGLGVGDTAQHANDTWWEDLTTAGGTYSITCLGDSNHGFANWYDRSSPSVANVLNNGGILTFLIGEHLNNSGLAHQVTGGTTILTNILVSAGGASVSAGQLEFKGRSRLIGNVAVSGTGAVDMTDPALSMGNCNVNGSAGTLYKSDRYLASGPVLTGWTGTTHSIGWSS